MATEGWAEATRLIDVARQQYGAEKSRAEAAEAKLAKAVEGLKVISQFNPTTSSSTNVYAIWKMADRARTTLAEIEGEKT
jgi:hypothetical protein